MVVYGFSFLHACLNKAYKFVGQNVELQLWQIFFQIRNEQSSHSQIMITTIFSVLFSHLTIIRELSQFSNTQTRLWLYKF